MPPYNSSFGIILWKQKLTIQIFDFSLFYKVGGLKDPKLSRRRHMYVVPNKWKKIVHSFWIVKKSE